MAGHKEFELETRRVRHVCNPPAIRSTASPAFDLQPCRLTTSGLLRIPGQLFDQVVVHRAHALHGLQVFVHYHP